MSLHLYFCLVGYINLWILKRINRKLIDLIVKYIIISLSIQTTDCYNILQNVNLHDCVAAVLGISRPKIGVMKINVQAD